MLGRVDVDKYFRAAETLENFVVLHTGAVQRRPGTRFVAAAKATGLMCMLIPFQFSTTQAYVLEFGHQYIRFFSNSGQVVSSPGVPLEVATTYLSTELRAMDFSQSADTLHITHPNHPPAVLQRFSSTIWKLSDFATAFGTSFVPPSYEYGARPTGTVTAGGLTGSQTFTASVDTFLASDIGRNIVIIAGTNTGAKALITAVADTKHATATIVTSSPFTDTNAIAAGSWKLDNSPQTTMTNSAKTPMGITTVTLTAGADAFRGAAGWTGETDIGKYVLVSGGVFQITAIASTTSATATMLGEANATSAAPANAWTLEEAAWSALNGYPAATTFTDLDRLALGGTAAQPQTGWLSKSGDFYNFATGVNDDDAIIFSLNSNQVNRINWIATARNLVFGTSGSEWIISTPTNNPMTPSNISAKDQTTYGSSDTGKPQRLASVIIFLTRTGRKVRELTYSFDVDTYLAPDLTLLAEHITQPIKINRVKTSRQILEMDYQREPLSTLWCPRADGTLAAMTYLRDQNIIAWHRHVLGPSSHDPFGKQIPATATDSVTESCAVIPHPDGDREQVWVSVVRTINGGVVRYIEFLDDGGLAWDYLNTDCSLTYDGTQTTTLTPSAVSGTGVVFTAAAPIFTAAMVGSEIRVYGQAYRATITGFTSTTQVTATILSTFPSVAPLAASTWSIAPFTFAGIDYLEGRTVDVVGDGAPMPQQTVMAGSITNASAASRVEIGLHYESDLLTVRPEFPGGAGTAQMIEKRAANVSIRFSQTLGGTVNGSDIPWRSTTDLMGVPPPLFNDDKVVPNLGYDRAGRILIQQKQPAPMTVELLSGVYVVGE